MNAFEGKCALCPNRCGAQRKSSAGLCGVTDKVKIARYALHPFEEPCISFAKGSGTVFFCGCPLRCVFCQNYEVSRNETGYEISIPRLAEIFKELEDMGADNINLVNPTHYLPAIRQALEIYRPNIPIVYNTHGYENIEQLEMANDFVDIYLTDVKFFSPAASLRYTGKSNYFEVASAAAEFMIKSRKTHIIGGKMLKGVIVRHLVLPLGVKDARAIIEWFAALRSDAYFSLMAQYTPFGNIAEFPELQRKITRREYDLAARALSSSGIENCFLQSLSSASEAFIPDFSSAK